MVRLKRFFLEVFDVMWSSNGLDSSQGYQGMFNDAYTAKNIGTAPQMTKWWFWNMPQTSTSY